jgi:hypothetical protein
VFGVGAVKVGTSLAVLRVVRGAMLDVVLWSVLASFAVDPDFSVAVHAADLCAVVNVAYLEANPIEPTYAVSNEGALDFTVVHFAGCHDGRSRTTVHPRRAAHLTPPDQMLRSRLRCLRMMYTLPTCRGVSNELQL